MTTKRDTLDPIKVGKNRWFYVEKGGLHAYREVRLEDGSYVHTQDIIVPWSTIKTALAEHSAGVGMTRPRAKRRNK